MLLPLWEHGLKLLQGQNKINQMLVAPFMGAWIETSNLYKERNGNYKVAPFMGAWIETITYFSKSNFLHTVAPFMGAWIETRHGRA